MDPSDPSPPKQVLTKRIDDALQARAVDYGGEHTKVALRDSQGRAVFTTESTPGDGDYTLLTSTMSLAQSADLDAGAITEQFKIERGDGQGLSLEDELVSTLILHGQYEQAVFGNYATQDAEGCDIAEPGPGVGGVDWVNVASCSNKGKCCDQHDACYKMYHCKADSWGAGQGSAACKACNKLAVQCVFSPARMPGKSDCCATQSCGTDRGPTWSEGDPIPAFPNPATKTGLDPALGIGGRRGSSVRKTIDPIAGEPSDGMAPGASDLAPEDLEPGVDTPLAGDEDSSGGRSSPDQSDDGLAPDESDNAAAGEEDVDPAKPSAGERDSGDDSDPRADDDDSRRPGDDESDFTSGADDTDIGSSSDDGSDFAGSEDDYEVTDSDSEESASDDADSSYEEPDYEEPEQPDYEEPDYEEPDYEEPDYEEPDYEE